MCTLFSLLYRRERQGWPQLCAPVVLLLASVLSTFSIASDRAPADKASEAGGRELVVGKVTRNPKKHIRTLTPFADYLAAQLAEQGISRVRVKFARDVDQMIQFLQNGEVDYVTETAYGAARMMREANVRPELLRYKKGQRDYHSIVFTHHESDVQTLQQLKGRKIVFEDKDSTSGYFIPRRALEYEGLSLVELDNPTDTAPADKVGYFFSGGEQNTSALVYARLSDAGAVNNHDWDKPDHMPMEQRKYFRRLHASEPIPRAIELLHPDLPATTVQRIREVLLTMHIDKSRDARHALKKYQATSQFEAFTKQELARLEQLAKSLPDSSITQQQPAVFRSAKTGR